MTRAIPNHIREECAGRTVEEVHEMVKEAQSRWSGRIPDPTGNYYRWVNLAAVLTEMKEAT